MTRPSPKKRSGDKASIVYEQLRASILNGELASGAPLSQMSISRASGISRGPVREAMRRLQQDQLVVARANQGFNIAPQDISDLEAAFSLQLINVAFAIRIGVAFLTEPELRLLDRQAEMMGRAIGNEERDGWDETYRTFVLTLIRHAGDRTVGLVGQLIDDIRRYRANLNDSVPVVWYSGEKEFKAITSAALARDGERASAHYIDYMGRLSLLALAGAYPLHDASRLRATLAALRESSAAASTGAGRVKAIVCARDPARFHAGTDLAIRND